MEERGFSLAHTTIMRGVHQYGPELNERIRTHLKLTNNFGEWMKHTSKSKEKRCTYIEQSIPKEIRSIVI